MTTTTEPTYTTLCADCRRASVLADEELEWDCMHEIGQHCDRCGGTNVLANVRPHRADEPHAVVSAYNCPYPAATYLRSAEQPEPTPPAPRREIIYNRFDKCYDLFLDGQLVGAAWNYVDGEKVLDQLVYDRLQPQPPTPAAQMSALMEQYAEAKDAGRLDDAKAIKQQAEAIEAVHPGTAVLVKQMKVAA